MIDKLIIDQIEQQTSDKEVAVLLSGGVDSLSVAFAASRMGKRSGLSESRFQYSLQTSQNAFVLHLMAIVECCRIDAAR